MKANVALIMFLGLALAPGSARSADYSRRIADTVPEMPHGGGWDGSSKTTAALQGAVEIEDGVLRAHPERWMPSYCTGATYLTLVRMLEKLQLGGELKLKPEVQEALLARNQPDGVDFWGWMNANGPGASRLFWITGLGVNFTRMSKAQPGDLMKMWWTVEVGGKERGHLAIYLGQWKAADGTKMVKFWSSQGSSTPAGYAVHSVTLASIKHVIFSRVTNLAGLDLAVGLGKDEYLSSLLTKDSSFDEALKMSGLNPQREAAGDLGTADESEVPSTSE